MINGSTQWSTVRHTVLQLKVAFLKLSDHPNTVRYYETFEDATDIHLVMETGLSKWWIPEILLDFNVEPDVFFSMFAQWDFGVPTILRHIHIIPYS